MKNFSFTTATGILSTTDMKQLKGGASCGFLGEGSTIAKCGLSEGDAMAMASQFTGEWCCYDCKTRTNNLRKC